jgi:hypothetical protein
MEFVRFLEDIPQTGRRYVGMGYTQNSWLPIAFTYWGVYKGEHLLQDESGSYLDPKRVIYMREIATSEVMKQVENEFSGNL